jgi:FkbH-like protein
VSVLADTNEYLELLRAGRRISENEQKLPELRVALLCDHAPQQFALVLKAALLEMGVFPQLRMGDYGATAVEAYDPGSELYEFKPDVAVYGIVVQKYRDRFYQAEDPAAREALPSAYLQEVLGVIDALLARGVGVVVNNLALPVERMFGNYGALTSQSLYGSVLRFNHMLHEAIAARRDCLLNDVMYVAAQSGAAFFDERLWLASKYPCANTVLPEVARSTARALAARKGRVTKVLVLDLDNTLWGGVIGDDGLEGIGLGGDAYGEGFQAFQRYLLALRDRGYVLAVCSKNNENVALECFRKHAEMVMREEDVSLFVANWNDKASNIEYIARVLNLGIDSFVFLDDSPFERDLVRTKCPRINVPELPDDVAEFVACIERSGLLEATAHTEEDYSRNQKYREEAQRTTEQIKYASIDDYLKSLKMRMTCGPFKPEDLPRVAQLIQRSNQFNLRTQRLSQAACERHAANGEVTVAARLADRFGDYGLIAVACCETLGDELFVAELVMSCRVLKRGVEEYLMNHLFAECARRGLRGVRGEYIRSAKNQMVKDFYKGFGFHLVESNGERDAWALGVDEYRPRATEIEEAS